MAVAAALMGLCLLALAGMSALWQLLVFYSLGRSLAQSASQTRRSWPSPTGSSVAARWRSPSSRSGSGWVWR